MPNKIENDIKEAEEQLREAMIASDINQLDQLLAPELIFTNHLGQVISKQDDLDAHRTGDFVINDLVLSQCLMNCTEQLAIVSVHVHISGCYKGSATNDNFRFTRVWVKQNGSWRIIAGHSCLIEQC